MRIAVDGTELYFDVEGPALVPNGEAMRESPILIALHGGLHCMAGQASTTRTSSQG